MNLTRDAFCSDAECFINQEDLEFTANEIPIPICGEGQNTANDSSKKSTNENMEKVGESNEKACPSQPKPPIEVDVLKTAKMIMSNVSEGDWTETKENEELNTTNNKKLP